MSFYEGMVIKNSKPTELDKKIGERVQQLLDTRGLKYKPFAEQIGIDPSNFGRLRKGERRWNTTYLEAVAKALGVNITDLFPRPDEPILLRDARPLTIPHRQLSNMFIDEHVLIPFYKIKVAAGLTGIASGDYPEKEDDFPFKRYWLASKGYSGERVKDLILMRAKGDSMEPTICDEETIMVDIGLQTRIPENIKNGRVYVIRWGITKEDFSVKRIYLDWPNKHAIAVSDNPLYNKKDIDLVEYDTLQEFILGRVIWVGKENI